MKKEFPKTLTKEYVMENSRRFQKNVLEKHYPEVYNSLKDLPGKTLTEKLWRYFNGEPEPCPVCGKPTKFLSLSRGFKRWCSPRCAQLDEETREKFRNTCEELYGTDNPAKNTEVKEKIRQTQEELYGGLGLAGKETLEKAKSTCVERYGVDNPFAADEVKERIKETNLERYGVEYNTQSPEVQERRRENTMEKYGVDHHMKVPEIKQKVFDTTTRRYGGVMMKSPIIREKIRQTNIDKYGSPCNFANKEIQKKIRKTFIERYGVPRPTQNESVKKKIWETNMKRYGVPYTMQSPEVQEKSRRTNIERYGVPHPMQNKEVSGKLSEILRNKYLRKNVKNVIGYTEDGDWIIKCSNKSCRLKDECDGIFTSRPGIYNDRLRLNVEPCLKINPISHLVSFGETELFEFVNSIIPTEANVRILNGLEIDCYIDSLKLGVEFNGLYWHSLAIKDPDYHFNKWLIAREKGIRLITIWEDDWRDRREWCEGFIRAQIEGNTTVHDPDWIYLDSCSEEEWLSIDPDKVELYEEERDKYTVVGYGRVSII